MMYFWLTFQALMEHAPLPSPMTFQRPTRFAAMLFALAILWTEHAALARPTISDSDLVFRRYRGADEVDDRSGSGSSGSGSSGSGRSESRGGGSDSSGGRESSVDKGGSSGDKGGSRGGKSSSGKSGGGKSTVSDKPGGGTKPDDDDRFGK